MQDSVFCRQFSMKLLFRMKPQSAFYAGDYSEILACPFPHSDMLFQAIAKAWEMLWGKAKYDLLESYLKDTKPFSISSIFPVIGNVYFVPKPISWNILASTGKGKSTSIPPIYWISAETYRAWLAKQETTWNTKNFIHPGLYASTLEMEQIQCQVAWNADYGRLRNCVEVCTGQATAFAANQVFYAKELDWYFIAECTQEYSEKLEATIRLLADEGIGGRRSIGCGAFQFIPPMPIPASLDFVEKNIEGNFVIFSLYHPSAADIQNNILENAAYQWTFREPWRRNAQQQQIGMLQEGSCFSKNMSAYNALLDITNPGMSEHAYTYVYPFQVVAPEAGGKHE